MTLALVLDRQSNLGLVDQIVGGVARAIEARTLRAGDALPSVRALARGHAVSSPSLRRTNAWLSRGMWWRVEAPRTALRVSPPR